MIMNNGWTILPSDKLPGGMIQKMYDMYVDIYTKAGEDIWFKEPMDLLTYPCTVYLCTKDDRITCYMFFQLRRLANKISLLVHDGTPESANILYDKLAQLLVSSGFVLEAMGAVSWLLRSRYHLAPIMDAIEIADILQSQDKNEIIKMNLKYDLYDRDGYVYTRITPKRNNPKKYWENNESLFGRACKQGLMRVTKQFTDETCHRNCQITGII